MYSFSIGVFLKCDVSLHSGKEKNRDTGLIPARQELGLLL